MTSTHTHQVGTFTAAYLRCFPYDIWRMALHVHALEVHADILGLLAPRVFLDNGVSHRMVQPQLRLLLAHASVGLVHTVLIPGSWVFSLDDRRAGAVTAFLQGAGARVVELPHGPDVWTAPGYAVTCCGPATAER
ncbi:hypothetical protein FBY35_3400 [Streptomyces sp. SLBN-118]|uniref:hypothetical protein n=1 Tax=Streptomyces sp. SLBN-118 TaxID=2768454 RepID=UPI0011504D4C|nr:hypothetical protein [Streptomyces sp. SLBN-118]TQK52937.1 hypothetical protein FBY35_3400 [Streptomyces sp. SLBN-118]